MSKKNTYKMQRYFRNGGEEEEERAKWEWDFVMRITEESFFAVQ